MSAGGSPRRRPIAPCFAKTGTRRWTVWGCLIVGALILESAASSASARDLFEEGEIRLELRSALKGSWLLAFPPDDPLLYPESPGGAGLFRLRFDLSLNLTEHFTAGVAYEHRALASSAGAIGGGLLPPSFAAPFRLEPLDWVIVEASPTYLHRHELDRAFVAVHFDFMDLTVGRQAIGMGRGVLFSAVDVFAPFSPTEIDREWRRGVDGLHLSLRVPELSQITADLFVTFGDIEDDRLTSWSAIGRLRAQVAELDASLLLGRRGEDDMVGAVLSTNLGDAELHGEFALFGTDGTGIAGGWLGTDDVVAKALLGGSYVIDVGRGLRMIAEYHYSGFGLPGVASHASLLFDPDFQRRFARGDSQLLGRHALALVASYDLADDLSAAISWIQSLEDGSGVLAPTLTWNFADNITIVFNVTAPWGTWPEGGLPTSAYGSGPFTCFLQARLYD